MTKEWNILFIMPLLKSRKKKNVEGIEQKKISDKSQKVK